MEEDEEKEAPMLIRRLTHLVFGIASVPGGGGGRGRGGMSLFRIVHARGAIPDEVGPARCRATPALNQSADDEEENFLSRIFHTRGGIHLESLNARGDSERGETNTLSSSISVTRGGLIADTYYACDPTSAPISLLGGCFHYMLTINVHLG